MKLNEMVSIAGTVAKLASIAGVERGAVQRWKNGTRVPNRQSRKLLKLYFGEEVEL